MRNRDVHIGFLFTPLRVEENWLMAAFQKRAVSLERIDDRKLRLFLEEPDGWGRFDAVLARNLSFPAPSMPCRPWRPRESKR